MPTMTREELNTTLMVGLEIHVELATRSKMWTSAPNVAHPDHYEAAPNTLCDPVVVGMPGTLPVINKEAVEMSILVGLALNCTIAEHTKWDRKSYYYPDLPKNYQISQYDQPICAEGWLDIPLHAGPDAPTKRVRIIRAHLEEDAGKLLHEAPGGAPIDGSIVDLNRAGTPLLEIVTYPDLTSAEEVVIFCQTLRNICRHLGVTEGVMQRGHMRFEPNINVLIDVDGEVLKTPIVEIKNLNSFKAVHGAVQHEFERQIEAWMETGVTMTPGTKSTRGWDDVRGVTVLQREKEEAHDYRYFPDPDLVPVTIDAAWRERVRAKLPELPLARRQRYMSSFGLTGADVDALVDEPAVARFYEDVMAAGVEPKRAATLLLNNLAKRANDRGVRIDQVGVSPAQLKGIADLLAGDKVGSAAADKLFELCASPGNSDEPAEALAQKHGLLQVSDAGALAGYVDQVLGDPKNAKAIAEIKAGNEKAINSLMGQIMKLSKGQANAKLVTELVKQKVLG